MTDPKLIENKTASVLINLFNKNDINDQVKMARMPRYMTDDLDRDYGQRPQNDMFLDDYKFGS